MHPSTQAPPDFPPAFLPFFFVGMWLLVSFIISQFGWRSFSSRYPAHIRPSGIAYNSPSSWFGILGHYHNVVRVVFTDAGVYCYVLFLFRAFHPPFLVPWESVRRVEKKDGFFGSYYWVEIENDAGRVRLRLPAKIEDDLSRYHKAA
jgi:hypothetical protein